MRNIIFNEIQKLFKLNSLKIHIFSSLYMCNIKIKIIKIFYFIN